MEIEELRWAPLDVFPNLQCPIPNVLYPLYRRTGSFTGIATGGLPVADLAGLTGIARGGTDEVAFGTAPLRLNSVVSLKYQIKAPPPTTRVKVRRVMSRPRQDFIRES
jgi:hypothetical protein